jgi:hypothetical protein
MQPIVGFSLAAALFLSTNALQFNIPTDKEIARKVRTIILSDLSQYDSIPALPIYLSIPKTFSHMWQNCKGNVQLLTRPHHYLMRPFAILTINYWLLDKNGHLIYM